MVVESSHQASRWCNPLRASGRAVTACEVHGAHARAALIQCPTCVQSNPLASGYPHRQPWRGVHGQIGNEDGDDVSSNAPWVASRYDRPVLRCLSPSRALALGPARQSPALVPAQTS